MIDADMLIILTAVEKVAINFGKENEQWLDRLSLSDAERFIEEGHFAKGSMLPKVEAAASFARSPWPLTSVKRMNSGSIACP